MLYQYLTAQGLLKVVMLEVPTAYWPYFFKHKQRLVTAVL